MRTSFKKWLARFRKRTTTYLEGRPHRSFQLTRRRDAVQELELPGYIAFTHYVSKTLWTYRKIFLSLGAVYAVLFAVLVGVQSQDTFTELTDAVSSAGAELLGGDWNSAEQATVVLGTIASLGTISGATEVQQLFSIIIFLLVWLSTVWLLRNLLAGYTVKMRDGIYNSGAPLFSTMIITLFIGLQLLPVALAAIGYSAAVSSGLLETGIAAMLFWCAAALLAVLSLFWISGSFFAMIIVTIPGMYPYEALKTASQVVLGRRVKLLLRLVWMALVVALAWVLVMLPAILIDMGLKALWPAVQWLPILPLTLLVVSACAAVWVAAYIYLLYRKVVEYEPTA